MSNLEKINVLTKDKLDSLDLTQYPNQIFGTTDEVTEGGESDAVSNEAIEFAESERQKSKNLLKFPYYGGNTQSNFGITYIVSDNGSISVSGNNTSTVSGGFYTLEKDFTLKAGTYTFSANKSESLLQVESGKEQSYFKLLPFGATSHTFTLTEDTTFNAILVVTPKNAGVVEVQNFQLQLEKGSVATEQQQYNGEIVHKKDIQRSILYVSMLDATEVQIPANTSTLIPFAQYVSVNAENKLTLSDNKIYIGKGVSKVLMSGGFRAKGETGTGGTWCAIKKNGVNVRSVPYYVSGDKLNTVPQFLFDVQEGDFIQVNIFDQHSSISIKNDSTNKETSFILEVVE